MAAFVRIAAELGAVPAAHIALELMNRCRQHPAGCKRERARRLQRAPLWGRSRFEEVYPGSAGWRAMEADCGLVNFRVTVLSQASVRFATAPET
jgi:hypothetical protein